MRLVLGSQSPRRKYLLEQMGLKFEVIPSTYEEVLDDTQDVLEVAKELGLGKALNVAEKHPDALVIGSDTIVVIDGKQLEKPVDADDQRAMMALLSGRKHQIVTSIALVCKDKDIQDVDVESMGVTFKELDGKFVEAYIKTGNPFDKAGGYAIQHPLVRPKIAKLDGRLDATIGLPTKLLSEMLNRYDYDTRPLELSKEFLAKAGMYE